MKEGRRDQNQMVFYRESNSSFKCLFETSSASNIIKKAWGLDYGENQNAK